MSIFARIPERLQHAIANRLGFGSLRAVSHGATVDQIQVLARPEFWSAAETRDKLRSLVPEYRLSKFQRALPDRWQSELVGAYLLDFDGAGRVASAFGAVL